MNLGVKSERVCSVHVDNCLTNTKVAANTKLDVHLLRHDSKVSRASSGISQDGVLGINQ